MVTSEITFRNGPHFFFISHEKRWQVHLVNDYKLLQKTLESAPGSYNMWICRMIGSPCKNRSPLFCPPWDLLHSLPTSNVLSSALTSVQAPLMEAVDREEAGCLNLNEKDTAWFVVLPSSSVILVSRMPCLNGFIPSLYSPESLSPSCFIATDAKYCIPFWVSKRALQSKHSTFFS